MNPSTPVTVGRERIAVLLLHSAERAAVLAVPDAGVSLDAVERALIVFALERTGGNRTHAARLLGLTRSALLYRMHKHHLDGAVPAQDARSVENP